jgi:hypothetical protein
VKVVKALKAVVITLLVIAQALFAVVIVGDYWADD